MSRRAQRSKLCPTPSKARYWDEAEAVEFGQKFEREIVASHRPLREFYVYRCACLRWHLTHHKFSREGAFNRKVSA